MGTARSDMSTPSVLPKLAVLICIASGCTAGKLSVLFSRYQDGSGPLQLSVLDPQSGIIDRSDSRVLNLPALPTQEQRWVLGNGTHGQTSTIFPTNQSVFFLAQVSDGSK